MGKRRPMELVMQLLQTLHGGVGHCCVCAALYALAADPAWWCRALLYVRHFVCFSRWVAAG